MFLRIYAVFLQAVLVPVLLIAGVVWIILFVPMFIIEGFIEYVQRIIDQSVGQDWSSIRALWRRYT